MERIESELTLLLQTLKVHDKKYILIDIFQDRFGNPRPAAMNHEMTGDQVSGMLSFISPDVDYHTWIEIGMALHSEGYSLDVWEGWSQTGSKYRQGDCYRRWAGFDKSAGITMGSLWYHAELGGWTPALLDNEVAIDTSAADAFIASALANKTGRVNRIKLTKTPSVYSHRSKFQKTSSMISRSQIYKWPASP